MKKFLILFLLPLITGWNVRAQEINLLNNEIQVHKGKITLSDGKSVDFRNLKFTNNLFNFTDKSGNAATLESSQVFKVVKTGNYAGYGAALGGLSALLGGLQGLADAESQGYDTSNSGSVLVGVTVGGAVIGGLIGLAFKKEKTIYKNNSALSFYPSLNKSIHGNVYPSLSLNINLNQ